MITIKRLLYYLDEATTEENLYISIKDFCRFFYDEDPDYNVVHSRIRNQLNNYRHLFVKKKISGVNFYRLSKEGFRYLNYFKKTYDPINDKNLY